METTKPTGPLLIKTLEAIQNQIIQKDSEFICCLCGKYFDLADNSLLRLENRANLKCPLCVSDRIAQDEAKRMEAIESKKTKLLAEIPNSFKNTSREKLPNPEKLDVALRWQYGAKGLLVYGPTGAGKSRIIWEIAKREILNGRQIKNLNAYELTKYPSL